MMAQYRSSEHGHGRISPSIDPLGSCHRLLHRRLRTEQSNEHHVQVLVVHTSNCSWFLCRVCGIWSCFQKHSGCKKLRTWDGCDNQTRNGLWRDCSRFLATSQMTSFLKQEILYSCLLKQAEHCLVSVPALRIDNVGREAKTRPSRTDRRKRLNSVWVILTLKNRFYRHRADKLGRCVLSLSLFAT